MHRPLPAQTYLQYLGVCSSESAFVHYALSVPTCRSIGIPTEPKRPPVDLDRRVNIGWWDLSGPRLGQTTTGTFRQKHKNLLVGPVEVPTDTKRLPADFGRSVNICWWHLPGSRLRRNGQQQSSTEMSISVGGVCRDPHWAETRSGRDL